MIFQPDLHKMEQNVAHLRTFFIEDNFYIKNCSGLLNNNVVFC